MAPPKTPAQEPGGLSKLNIGIIGCGRISDLHAPGYRDNARARIHAVCDLDPDTAALKKHQWQARKMYTDYRELLADPDIDGVEILSPQGLHEQMVLDAAAAKKHISLQKPMTVDLKSADRMVAAAKSAGICFKITDNYLFYPPVVRARQMIEDGRIGTPCNLRMKLISGTAGGWEVPPGAWQWRLKEKEAGRGVQLFDHGHHLWASAWYLLGGIERVKAWADSVDGVIDSPAAVMWKHSHGTVFGMCEYAHGKDLHIPSRYYANDEWIEITGSKGLIQVRQCTGNINEGPGLRMFDGYKWHDYPDVPTDWKEGFIGSTRNFIAAISGEEAPLLSPAQGREILKINLAITKSTRVRREVYVDELEAAIPGLYTWNRIRKEKRKGAGGLFSFLGRSDRAYADRAVPLTLALADRGSPDSLKGWDTTIGLKLIPDSTGPETLFSVRIQNGEISLEQGRLPPDAELTLSVPQGTWAAVLLGRRKIEAAFLTGKLKLEGRAETALKLKDALNL